MLEGAGGNPPGVGQRLQLLTLLRGQRDDAFGGKPASGLRRRLQDFRDLCSGDEGELHVPKHACFPHSIQPTRDGPLGRRSTSSVQGAQGGGTGWGYYPPSPRAAATRALWYLARN